VQDRPEQGIWLGAPVAGHEWPLRSPGRRVRAHPAGSAPRTGADARCCLHGLADGAGGGGLCHPGEGPGSRRDRVSSGARRPHAEGIERDADPATSRSERIRSASAVPVRKPSGRGAVTLSTPLDPLATAITVLPSSRAMRRAVGPLAWLVLEELALGAEQGPEGLAVETSVRDLAARLNVGKDAAASAVARLVDLGLVECRSRRRAGRYAGSTYVVDPVACSRAGLVLNRRAVDGSPCPDAPCPVKPNAVAPGTADRPDPSERSTPSTPPSLPLFPLVPSTTPALPTPATTLPPTSLSLLTPFSQHDTSAPGVRQRGAGSR
jgi:MarR family